MDDYELFVSSLKCCPTCGADLEPHPLSGDAFSCYTHGDFLISKFEGKRVAVWRPMQGRD